MLKVIGVLLLLWLALVVIGLIVKALFWLFIVGAVLFVGTALFGGIRRRMEQR